MNQWITRTVDTDGDGTPDEKTVFVHDGGQIVMQLDDTVTTASEDLTKEDLSHRYLWGPAVDQLLADEQVHWDSTASDMVTDEVLWALTDHKGTVHDLAIYDEVNGTTDVVNHLVYDAFGNLQSQSNASHDTLFRYNGKPQDTTTGDYWMQARWYDPTTGSWLSKDFVWDDTNSYGFVGNKATTSIDPTGLFNEDMFWDNVRKFDEKFLRWFQMQSGTANFGDYWWSSLRTAEDGSPVAHIDTDLNEWEAAVKFVNLQDQFIGPGNHYKASLICSSSDPASAYQEYIQNWYKKAVRTTVIGTQAYLSLLSFYNEGYDIVITAADVGGEIKKGQFYSAAFNSIGFLPYVSNAQIVIFFRVGEKIKVPQAVRSFMKTGKKGLGFVDHPSLVKHLGRAGDNHSWHHLVQQRPRNLEKFTPQDIHNTCNVIALPNGTHDNITKFQQQANRAVTGNRTQTVQDWISQFTYEEQWQFGKALVEYELTGSWPPGYVFPRL
ncbi:RHS repeat-associated core domain-containing protein [Aeoliella mucimassa]|nr:RHS repeat-associated core domain-containing protein [Aeoliella mucimassa]